MLFGTNPFFRWSYVTGNWDQIQGDLVQHIALSLIAIAIGTAISIPLAVLAWRYRFIRTPVFGVHVDSEDAQVGVALVSVTDRLRLRLPAESGCGEAEHFASP